MGLLDFLKKTHADLEAKTAESNEKLEEKKKKLEEEKAFLEARIAENKAKLAAKKAEMNSKGYKKVAVNNSFKNLEIPKPHVMNIKVAGVTFENRQDILKKIYNKQKPFDKRLDIEFIGVDFNGELAIEIKVNKHLIGYVEKKRINEFVKHMEYGYKITKFFPGYNEKSNIYHCTIKIEFAK